MRPRRRRPRGPRPEEGRAQEAVERQPQRRQQPGIPFAAVKLGLDWPRALLYGRIDARVIAMVNAGLVDEVRITRGVRPIAGVPSALFFALLTFFTSFVPAVGTMLVWLPLAALKFGTGHPGAGAFLVLMVFLLAGITPMKSLGMARYMKTSVPGMDVPDDVVKRMADAVRAWPVRGGTVHTYVVNHTMPAPFVARCVSQPPAINRSHSA
mgnify:CR=1 FL=1